MAIAQRLELRQGQSLVMTPQLQQAIKLLQLSQIELASFVEQELERNPLLTRDEGSGDDSGDADRPSADNPADGDGPRPSTEGPVGIDRDIRDQADMGQQATSLQDGYENVFGDDSVTDRAAQPSPGPDDLTETNWAGIGAGGRGDFDDSEFSGDERLASAVSLRDHLMAQLAELALAGPDRLMAANLVDSLDEAGYLTESSADIAARLGIDEVALEALLRVLQELDPPGVFARSLQECLEIQCREADRLDPSMAAVLRHLDLVARRDLSALARHAGVDEDEIIEIIKEIRTLNPKPGHAFDTAPVQAVIPDVFIRRGSDGDWLIELNAETMPRVLIDRRYAARLSGSDTTRKDDKAYLSDCLASANWLVKALDQRARTILKVATSLVRQQDAFLRFGIAHLRPMNLKAIAEEIGMHESTVSRVTANKWVWTPRGLFEMKFFFTAAIGSTDGSDAHSAESVRHRLRQLIDAEVPNAILSDDKLVELLKRDGIDIARRTVAKYREAMGIGSSTERRRQKAIGRR
ncbi:RNA polymerase factor sigma-54 [Zavarzinia sp.]|uniref:RNA polymerase factor sigma-54 n=1 Tax=Zavarzinia sp. TaxID=2027920 RepID=UPI003BB66D2A